MIRHLVECEHDYINCDHPEFIGGRGAIRQVMQERSIKATAQSSALALGGQRGLDGALGAGVDGTATVATLGPSSGKDNLANGAPGGARKAAGSLAAGDASGRDTKAMGLKV